ncbi:DUF350 domain-containing protein [Vibrio marisflavi]|uniref:DUF350 domain-containing protein n=1 Tax=Vibrio marisflavi CECT 7928 TaxID=634439 RepID=A0ABM9A1A6_9VIBR|nr:DUF350 domain-containing protein [Vibrio marisflavi]CAH0537417.1 hypothetical protein VMF7928_01099 [Vibrio marisflavi CECT 7928]
MAYIDLHAVANFSSYFATSLFFLIAFIYICTFITRYDEWKLIKEGNNLAASIALSGSVIGYAIAVNGVLKNAVNFHDFVIWGIVALITQVIAIVIVRFMFMPKFAERIENNESQAAIIAAAFYIAVGLLNAGCMTY